MDEQCSLLGVGARSAFTSGGRCTNIVLCPRSLLCLFALTPHSQRVCAFVSCRTPTSPTGTAHEGVVGGHCVTGR